jgi:hypothetical protein
MDSYTDTVGRIIDERREQKIVSPSWVATEALAVIEPNLETARPAYELSHATLRQIARSLLRGKFEPNDSSEEKHDLFPDLQKRYPIKKASGEEPVYVVLEEMSDADIAFNVKRLRQEGAQKIRHADALEAFRRTRLAA